MSTHQFQMTYLRVFLSIQSNVSLFIQWITRSFTKALSCSVTGLNQPDSVQNNAASLVVNKVNLLRNYLHKQPSFKTFRFLLDLSALEKRSESRRLSAISTSSKLFSVYSTNGKRAGFVSKLPTSEARYQNRKELKVIPTTGTRWQEAVLSSQQRKVSLSQNGQL